MIQNRNLNSISRDRDYRDVLLHASLSDYKDFILFYFRFLNLCKDALDSNLIVTLDQQFKGSQMQLLIIQGPESLPEYESSKYYVYSMEKCNKSPRFRYVPNVITAEGIP